MSRRPKKTRLEPRRKPAQARSSDTVQTILEAAARILEERGFEGYNTNDVAARAGVSIGSLYQYFPNKDAVTKALIQRETMPLKAGFVDVRHAPSLRDGLLRFINAAVTHQLRRPVLARLLDFEEARLPLTSEVRYISDIAISSIEDLLAASGAPRTGELFHCAQDINAIVKGMVDDAGERGEKDANGLETRVRHAVFGYLRQVGIARV